MSDEARVLAVLQADISTPHAMVRFLAEMDTQKCSQALEKLTADGRIERLKVLRGGSGGSGRPALFYRLAAPTGTRDA